MDSVYVGMYLEGKWGRKQAASLLMQDLSLGSEQPAIKQKEEKKSTLTAFLKSSNWRLIENANAIIIIGRRVKNDHSCETQYMQYSWSN